MEAIRLEADAFLYSETELEEAMESVPDLQGASEAGGFLRAVRHYSEERQACIDGYDGVIAEYEASKARKVEQFDARLAWLESALKAHYVHSGQKKLGYPDGSLSMRKGRESVVVADPGAFCEAHKTNGLVSVTVAPDKAAIKKHITDTGEIPEGADLVRGDDTFVVKTK